MRGRERALDLFLNGGDGSQPEFEEALDEYAHDLAERVRGAAKGLRYAPERRKILNNAADLIDPEVEG